LDFREPTSKGKGSERREWKGKRSEGREKERERRRGEGIIPLLPPSQFDTPRKNCSHVPEVHVTFQLCLICLTPCYYTMLLLSC